VERERKIEIEKQMDTTKTTRAWGGGGGDGQRNWHTNRHGQTQFHIICNSSKRDKLISISFQFFNTSGGCCLAGQSNQNQ
jgi:hypothetical protein